MTTGRVTGPKSGAVGQKYDDFGSFKSFFTPVTQFERLKPCFPNSPVAKAPSKVRILKISPVRGELGVRNDSREVSKLAVYALRHHFAPPKPDLGGRNQILSPLLDVGDPGKSVLRKYSDYRQSYGSQNWPRQPKI